MNSQIQALQLGFDSVAELPPFLLFFFLAFLQRIQDSERLFTVGLGTVETSSAFGFPF